MEVEKIHHIHRIVILTLDSLYSGVALHDFVTAFPERIVLICASKRYGGKYGSFFAQLRRNWIRSGYKFVNYLSYHFIYYHVFLHFTDLINIILRRPKKVYSIRQLAKKFGINTVESTDPNSAEIVAKIRATEPDLIISVYFDHVIRKPIINLPKFGVINVHTALLPDYRGPFPPLWPILKKEQKIGVTIQYVNNERLDAGPILAQKIFPLIKGESVLGADCRLVKEGIALAKEVIIQIENGHARAVAQEVHGPGNYYSYPRKADLKHLSVPLVKTRDFVKQYL
ncbi:MAG: hypothetical protein HYV68_00675 [Candidatus Taylorbacteria bacterium]|nr:hypothetical protein [Candidatus Taylorbacteria bacterium]